jgi:hypothetical protein
MDGILNCVVCGQRFLGSEGGYDNHHCPESILKRREATNRQAEQDYLNRRPSEAMRINYGFHLLSLRGDF